MFNIEDYVLSNYMPCHGNGNANYPIFCIGKISKFKDGFYDFAIRNITATDKNNIERILEDFRYFEKDKLQYGCFKYNLRPLELTDPHFINAIVNQVFVEKEEEIKFKEYIRAKIQLDFKIPTLDSGYEPEKGLITSLADIISVKQGILTEGEIHTTKPNVVWI